MGKFLSTVSVAILMMGAISLWVNRMSGGDLLITAIGMVGALVPLLGLSYWLKAIARLSNYKAADLLLESSAMKRAKSGMTRSNANP
ncbi:MAG: hypothetical protein M1415_10620 [Firmicutes bacterium]|jgi:hypothetical protein|nr:hypothetical protein [Bacillota bacterium]